MAFAYFEDGVLDFIGGGVGSEFGEFGVEVGERGTFGLGRGTALEGRRDEISRVVDREADQGVELGIGFGRGAGGVALDEAPRGRLVADPGERGEV